jgi:hypothetical protein
MDPMARLKRNIEQVVMQLAKIVAGGTEVNAGSCIVTAHGWNE